MERFCFNLNCECSSLLKGTICKNFLAGLKEKKLVSLANFHGDFGVILTLFSLHYS